MVKGLSTLEHRMITFISDVYGENARYSYSLGVVLFKIDCQSAGRGIESHSRTRFILFIKSKDLNCYKLFPYKLFPKQQILDMSKLKKKSFADNKLNLTVDGILFGDVATY